MNEAQHTAEQEWLDEVAEILDLTAGMRQAAAVYGDLPAMPLTVISATKVDPNDGLEADFPREAIKAEWLKLLPGHLALGPV